jgi:hypothetical protein
MRIGRFCGSRPADTCPTLRDGAALFRNVLFCAGAALSDTQEKLKKRLYERLMRNSRTALSPASSNGGSRANSFRDRGVARDCRGGSLFHWPASAGEPVLELTEIDIDHRRREQRQGLADDQAADHGVAERLPNLGAGAGSQHERHAAEDGRHRGHHDRTEAQQRRAANGVLRGEMLVLFRGHREIDEHDAVLLNDAYQEDDADQRDQAEIEVEQQLR